MMGMFTGEYLRGRGAFLSGGVRTFWMLAAATGLLLSGLFVAFGCGAWSMPLNKILWSSSFTLVVGGISLALFSAFHYAIDVKGYRKWCSFFRIIGLNSITVYMLQRIVPVMSTTKFFFEGLSSFFPPAVSSVVIQLGYITVCWLILWFLHRNKIYWKV
jgi:predicted acyltransferase